MSDREKELIIQLALCLGALKALAPKENQALQGVIQVSEDVLHGPEQA